MNPLYAVALWLAMQQSPTCQYGPTICNEIRACDEVVAGNPNIKCDHEAIISAMQHQSGIPMPGELQTTVFEFDVPSVKDTVQTFDNVYACSHVLELYSPWRGYYCELGKRWELNHETCADKSRILMRSEDGEGHCIKFPK